MLKQSFIFILLCMPLMAHAQNTNMSDRLNRLETDLGILQKEVYRKDAQKLKSAPSAPKKSWFGKKDDGNSAYIQAQIVELQEQIQQAIGRAEEVEHSLSRLEKKMDKVLEDIDFRLQQGGSATIRKVPQQTVQKNNDFASGPIDIQAGRKEALEKDGIQAESLENAVLAPQTAASTYDLAFKYMREADYKKAELTLKNFISTYPEHELLSNANYWLGETYYVKENYKKASLQFLKGYQEFPKGQKAADSLLKMGMSLSRLDKKKDACITYKKLQKEFPKLDKDLASKLKSERNKIDCK